MTKMMLRNLPAIEELLKTGRAEAFAGSYGRSLTLSALREAVGAVRGVLRAGGTVALPLEEEILTRAGALLADWLKPTLYPVINASGVILHTNLGRAPLSEATLLAMQAAGGAYNTLEYDVVTGKRGSRLLHAEGILQRLLGVEAAVVVNNNASAVLLVLSALANRKRVIIPRSQLVEIGGGFRIPDVMKQSGARLVEVGTTNKVRGADFEEALQGSPALVMRAHRSNFKIVGFHEEPNLAEIARIAHAAGAVVVDDLGSGALYDTARYGLAHEPTVQESLAAGADVVCFSGDKLMGGPQAGIIVGKKDLLDKIKRHPLARAVRADKTCLAGISTTLLHYLKDEAEREIPILRMMGLPLEEIQERATRWAGALGAGEVLAGESAVGGGSLPEETLPTYLLALQPTAPEKFLRRLRNQDPPIIGRVENEKVLLDPRTVLPGQEQALLAGLRKAWQGA